MKFTQGFLPTSDRIIRPYCRDIIILTFRKAYSTLASRPIIRAKTSRFYIRLTNSLAINMSESEMLISLGVGSPVFSFKLGHCLNNEPAAVLHF